MAIPCRKNSPYKISIVSYSKLLFSDTQRSYNSDSKNSENTEGLLMDWEYEWHEKNSAFFVERYGIGKVIGWCRGS